MRLFESTARRPKNSAILRKFLAQAAAFRREFGGGFFRHCSVLLCIPLFEATAKTTTSAIKAVAASSAMLPHVTAQTVASGRGFGGCILRRRTLGRQAQAARRRTQNSPRQILRFMSAQARALAQPDSISRNERYGIAAGQTGGHGYCTNRD
jgi:hypothetical protein